MNVSENFLPEFLDFFDSHLKLKLFDYYIELGKNLEELKKFKSEELIKTSLFDIQEEYFKNDSNFISKINENKENLVKQENEKKQKIIGYLNLIENLRNNNNYDTSSSISKKIIDETSINNILEYAKIMYDSGRYEEARVLLTEFYKISFQNKKNLSKALLGLWNVFSIDIMSSDWEIIIGTFNQIKQSIELLKDTLEEEFRKINFESTERIHLDFKQIIIHRGYLIHWSLFLLKNNREGIESYLNLVFDEKYFNLIENNFNYLLPYVVVMTLISKNKNYIIKLKETLYRRNNNHFVNLFNSIYSNFDLDKYIYNLNICVDSMKNDYFLFNYIDTFKHKSKEIAIDNYVILNNKIDIKNLSALIGNDSKELILISLRNNYPDVIINESEDTITYKLSVNKDVENYHILKVKDIYDLTLNMIDLINK